MPGMYTIRLGYGSNSVETEGRITPNPLIPTTQEEWRDYHAFMQEAEDTYTEMTLMTNRLHGLKGRLETLTGHLEDTGQEDLLAKANSTLKKLEAWDAEMVQRLSQAYDDVENYVNGFTAEYLTALNHGDSGIPRINKGTREKIAAIAVNTRASQAE